MKLIYFVLMISIITGCKTVSTQVKTSEDNRIIMISSEKWIFSEPEEKLAFTFSPENGGQVLSIFWEGKKVADDFSEKYPNNEIDLKELKPRVLDDGSGLIIVTSTLRNSFQLRRSYSLQYHEKTDEHIIEVQYHVKNYSSETDLNQQLVKKLSLPDSLKVEMNKSGISAKSSNLSFKIISMDVSNLEITKSGKTLQIGNKNSFKLGSKERLNWKVHYVLKSTD